MKNNWICKNCSEVIDNEFDKCWNCNYDSDGKIQSETKYDFETNKKEIQQEIQEKIQIKKQRKSINLGGVFLIISGILLLIYTWNMEYMDINDTKLLLSISYGFLISSGLLFILRD